MCEVWLSITLLLHLWFRVCIGLGSAYEVKPMPNWPETAGRNLLFEIQRYYFVPSKKAGFIRLYYHASVRPYVFAYMGPQ
jgi:hypothetical protein